MSNNNERQWPAILFFVSCGLFFGGCVWYLLAGAAQMPDQTGPDQATRQPASEPRLQKNEWTLLPKDRGVRVGQSRVVYRGNRHGVLHLDLYALALDPHVGYAHQIDEQRARKGFRMGDHHFQVLSASASKISLKRI